MVMALAVVVVVSMVMGMIIVRKCKNMGSLKSNKHTNYGYNFVTNKDPRHSYGDGRGDRNACGRGCGYACDDSTNCGYGDGKHNGNGDLDGSGYGNGYSLGNGCDDGTCHA